jgi:hypothetical protein
MTLQRKRQGRDQTMRKKTAKQCIRVVLAGMVLATYSVSVVGAQIAEPTAMDRIQGNQTIVLKGKELTDQGIHFEQIQSELHTMLHNIHTDIQKRGQSSLSLRGFSGNCLFSCRGFA